MKKMMLMVLALGLLVASRAMADGYTLPVTLVGYADQSESLTNFPVLIVLSNNVGGSGLDFATHPFLSTNGWDLRLRDAANTTNLDYEIESWASNGPCYVWVRVPIVAADGSTTILARWGDPANTNQLPCTTNGATWNSAYRGVWHLAGTKDATAFKNNGTDNGTDATTGRIGSGRLWNAGTDYITVPDSPSISVTGDLTMEAWVNASSFGSSSANNIFAKDGNNSYRWRVQDSGATFWCLIANSGFVLPSVPYAFTAARWYHLAIRVELGAVQKAYFYVNGTQVGAPQAAGKTSIADTAGALILGAYGVNSEAWSGTLDELRITGGQRSSNWVWACWMNQGSNLTFNAYGQVDSEGSPAAVNLAPSNIVSGAAFFNGQVTATGGAPVTVAAVYWGQTDGGTNATLWAHTNVFVNGPWNKGDLLTTNITELAAGADCFYTYYVANANRGFWAAPSTYLVQGELTLTITDNSCGSSPSDTVTITVIRPATCTGSALTVFYTMAGEATNGVHIAASPASGSLLIPAGQTNATIIITPLPPWNTGAPKAFSLSLAAGPYLVGDPATVSGTLQTIPAVTYTWTGTVGDWTASSRWYSPELGNGLPNNGSTGIIASGTAQLINPGNLYNAGIGETPPAEIRLQSGGKMSYKIALAGQPSLYDHHLVLDGGILETEHMDNGDIRYDHPISVRSSSIVAPYLSRPDRSGKLLWYGTLSDYDASHTGQLIKKNIYGRLWLGAPDSPFTGGWNIPEGLVGALARGALGTGNIVVTNGGAVGWSSGGDTTLPTIAITNGSLIMYGSGTYGLAAGKTLTVNGGSIYHSGDYNAVNYNMPVNIAGNLSLGGGTRSTESWNGDFINLGGATVTLGGVQVLNFTKLNNAYTGNWIIPYNSTGSGTMTANATASGALGAGGFVELRTNSLFSISQSLTLRNIITGQATLGAASKTLTLQPWYTNATLYTAGVSPGTNWGAAIGVLTVSGNLTFTNQVNYDGLGNSACCRLAIDVSGPAGSPTNDVLTATGNIAGLNNVDLYVSLTNVTPAALSGQTLVFLRAANAQDPTAFSRVVTPPGASISVTTNGLPNGSVGLFFRAVGTLLMIR